MADHVKTQIRDAVAASGVLGNLTTTGARVFLARPEEKPLQAATPTELPGLCIYTDEEELELGTLSRSGRRMIRTLQLKIRGYVQASGDIDKSTDTITKEVETAMAADVTLGGKCKDLWPVSVTKGQDAEGELPVAWVEIMFTVEYHTAQGAPDAALA